MTEATIEKACWNYALVKGIFTRKLAYGVVGDPDRVFFLPDGRCWLVEFKSPTGRLTPRQHLVHEAMAQAGHPVTVIRSLDEFKTALDIKLQATA